MYLNLPQNDNMNLYKTKGASWNRTGRQSLILQRDNSGIICIMTIFNGETLSNVQQRITMETECICNRRSGFKYY